jgi:Cu/Zn superoxide dismutase
MLRPSKRLVIIGVAAAAIAAAAPALALSGHPTSAASATTKVATVADTESVRHLTLRSMPTGSVEFTLGTFGAIVAHVSVYGLTPGSTHTVEIDTPWRDDVVRFGTVTAGATGQAYATLTAHYWGDLPYGSRLVLRLGKVGNSSVADEAIARTGQLSLWPFGHWYGLSAVDVTSYGTNEGQLSGRATVSYNAAAHTITVTVTASGLTPGAHAAHIHVGSCRSQGPVAYMLMDFTADGHGRITHETRTVTGVMTAPPATGWYLNLHQGTSTTILANGQPTLAFRPLLCANI